MHCIEAIKSTLSFYTKRSLDREWSNRHLITKISRIDILPNFFGMRLCLHARGAPLNIDFGQEAVWLAVEALELQSGGPEFNPCPNC